LYEENGIKKMKKNKNNNSSKSSKYVIDDDDNNDVNNNNNNNANNDNINDNISIDNKNNNNSNKSKKNSNASRLRSKPLYEIKLDRFPKKLIYIEMTTDPWLNYLYTQPLVKINNNPKIPKKWFFNNQKEHFFEIFGLQKKSNFYNKKNILAAWTIQRAFRVYKSKKIVERRRYEVWKQSIAIQSSLVHNLIEANYYNDNAYSLLTKKIKLQSKKKKNFFFFDEIKNVLIPYRLHKNVQKNNETLIIKKEYQQMVSDRTRFLQKMYLKKGKDYFKTGGFFF
jgi:hypothetical protein